MTTSKTATTDADMLMRLSQARFSCRAYLPDAVPTETIRAIMDIARRTASWSNVQPWQIVIASKDSTEKFRHALIAQATCDPGHSGAAADIAFPRSFSGPYLERRREAGYMLYAALGIGRGDKERRDSQMFENFRLFGAPHVAIVTTPVEIGAYGIGDCGAFVGSFLLAARAHGVATTAQAALACHAPFIRSYFGIGEDQNIFCGISFGYADEQHPVNGYRTRRAETDDLMRLV